MRNALSAYKHNRLTGIEDASPTKLVSMLLDEAIRCCESAALACEAGDVARKGQNISKTLSIIDAGLLSALDFERGGEIAQNFAGIYNYCLQDLVRCNAENDPVGIRHCGSLLTTLREAWRAAEAAEAGPRG
jgi:flagellar protein FliS